MQDATPDPIKPRHLSFLSPEESDAIYQLTFLPKSGDKDHLAAHPNQDEDSDDGGEGDADDLPLPTNNESPIPSGSKRKRAKRAIAGDLSLPSDAAALATPSRIEANVVIVKQPPTTWLWRDSAPTLDFDMQVGIVASDHPLELLPLDERAFSLWLMNEDGNGVFGHFKLQWTSDPCASRPVALMHVKLTVDTTDPPTTDQNIRIYVTYTDSKHYNAYPMETDDVFVRANQLHTSALSPIPGGSLNNFGGESSPPNNSPPKFPLELLNSPPTPASPPTVNMSTAFATAPADFLVQWAREAASLLLKLQSLPVPGTLLNQCPSCRRMQSLELPMIHSCTCSLKDLLVQVTDTSWLTALALDESDDLPQHHSLASAAVDSSADMMSVASWSLSRDLSLMSLDDDDSMTTFLENALATPPTCS